MRHNKIRLRDSVADMMKEVCYDVQAEPHLLPVDDQNQSTNSRTTNDENARLDVFGRGVWAPFD